MDRTMARIEAAFAEAVADGRYDRAVGWFAVARWRADLDAAAEAAERRTGDRRLDAPPRPRVAPRPDDAPRSEGVRSPDAGGARPLPRPRRR